MPEIEVEYGPHKYPEPMSVGYCEYGCGCEMDRSSNKHPVGVDAFGLCPCNIIKGVVHGNKEWQVEKFARERVAQMEQRLDYLEDLTERTRPTKKVLVERIAVLELALRNAASSLGHQAQLATKAAADATKKLE